MKTSVTKRLIAGLLSLVMLLSLSGVSAFAEELSHLLSEGTEPNYTTPEADMDVDLPTSDSEDTDYGVIMPSEPTGCDHTELHEESIDVGALGGCDYVIYYDTCACGAVKYVDVTRFEPTCELDFSDEDQNACVDENGDTVIEVEYACKNCAMQISMRAKVHTEGCKETVSTYVSFIFNGEVIAGDLYNEEVNESHTKNESFELDLVNYGACGVRFRGVRCAACDTIVVSPGIDCYACESIVSVDTYTDENGVEYSVNTIKCANCDFEKTDTRATEKIASCEKLVTRMEVIRVGDTVVYERTTETRSDAHAFRYSYELAGKDCNEGVTEIALCTVCGYTTTQFLGMYGHVETEPFDVDLNELIYELYDGELPFCGANLYGERCTLCKTAVYLSGDSSCDLIDMVEEEVLNEDGEGVGYMASATCSACGVRYVWMDYIGTDDQCMNHHYVTVALYCGEECLYELVADYEVLGDSHHYSEIPQPYDDEWHRFVCEDCGAETHQTHHWNQEPMVQAPSCSREGWEEYTCMDCGHTVRRTIPMDDTHSFGEGVLSEDGFFMTYTCWECGFEQTEDLRDSVCDHTVLHEESIDIGALGGCDYVIYYDTCACGKVKLVDFEKEIPLCEIEQPEEDIAPTPDENGNLMMEVEGDCKYCGMHLHAILKMYQENCERIIATEYDFYWNGEVLVEGLYLEDSYTDHEAVSMEEITLSDYGACGGMLYLDRCIQCGEIDYASEEFYDCQMEYRDESYTEDGITYNITVGTCTVCGLESIHTYKSVPLSICEAQIYDSQELRVGGVTLYCMNDEYQTDTHTFEYSYELLGESCYDGCVETAVCTKCGYSFTYLLDCCGIYGTESVELLEREGYNGCHVSIRAERCTLCGTVTCVYGDVDCRLYDTVVEEIFDESGNLIASETRVTCPDCGLSYFWRVDWKLEEDCEVLRYVYIMISDGDACILETSANYGHVDYRHIYGEDVEYDEYSHWLVCEACGYTSYSEHAFVESGLMQNPSCVENGWKEYVCLDCGYIKLETLYATGEHAWDAGVENEDGTLVTYTCSSCGDVRVVDKNSPEYNCDHTVLYPMVIDLGAHGACEGFVYYNACACGQVKILDVERFELSCSMEPSDSEHYVDENGDAIISQTGACSRCGMEFLIFVKEHRELCVETEYISITLALNGEVIANRFSSEETYEHHSNIEYFDDELHNWGACPGFLEGERCMDCGKVLRMNVHFEACAITIDYDSYVAEDGTTFEVETHRCDRCGIEWIYTYGSKQLPNCEYRNFESGILRMRGNTIYEYSRESGSTDHAYEYSYDMHGETCRDGVTVHAYCTECGDSYTNDFDWCGYSGSEHVELFNMHPDNPLLGGNEYCGGEIYGDRCTLCGMIMYMDGYTGCNLENVKEEEWSDDNGNYGTSSYATCPDCGLEYYWKVWYEATEGCSADKYVSLSIGHGDTSYMEADVVYPNAWEVHDFGPATHVDDYHHEQSCYRCGTTHWTSHNFVENGETQAPTCIENGWRDVYCPDCGYFGKEILYANGEHAWDDGVANENGTVITYTCYHCGETYEEHFSAPDIPVDPNVCYGDVDGNGIVNLLDLILLRRYLAEFDYDLGASAIDVATGADANGDGNINLLDSILLSEYLANYNYDTGMSSVVLGPQGVPPVDDPMVELNFVSANAFVMYYMDTNRAKVIVNVTNYGTDVLDMTFRVEGVTADGVPVYGEMVQQEVPDCLTDGSMCSWYFMSDTYEDQEIIYTVTVNYLKDGEYCESTVSATVSSTNGDVPDEPSVDLPVVDDDFAYTYDSGINSNEYAAYYTAV